MIMMEAARTSETSVDNYFTRQYFPEDKSELYQVCLFKNFFRIYGGVKFIKPFKEREQGIKVFLNLFFIVTELPDLLILG
jgi:hypothetical protein